MSHGMSVYYDVQYGLKMAWQGLTEIVEKITAFPFDYQRKAAQIDGEIVPGQEWIVTTDHPKRIVGPSTIAPSFQFRTNAQWIESVNAAMSVIPGSYIESLGTFDDRAKRYVTLCLNDKRETFKIGEREFQNRLNFQGSLDGKMKDRVKGSTICIVCKNTFGMSLRENSEFDLEAKHTKNHEAQWGKIDEAVEAFFNRSAEFERLLRSAEDVKVNENQAENAFLGFLEEGNEPSTRSVNVSKRLTELFKTGKGNRGETALDVISAVTDYYSHENARQKDDPIRQFASSEIGAGAKAKDAFLRLIATKKDMRFNKQAFASLVKMGERSAQLVEV